MSGVHMAATEAAVWTAVGVCEDIPAREGRVVHVGGAAIAVFNLGDRFLAVDDRCPHKGGPLSDGIVAGGAVVCPLHAWRINLESGDVERPCAAAPAVRTYTTKVEGGVVHVALTEPRR
jgi:nitrite reductase (NADH) small subunit